MYDWWAIRTSVFLAQGLRDRSSQSATFDLGTPPEFILLTRPISSSIAGFWLKQVSICDLRVHFDCQRLLWACLGRMKLSRRDWSVARLQAGLDCIRSSEHSMSAGAIASRRSICMLAADVVESGLCCFKHLFAVVKEYLRRYFTSITFACAHVLSSRSARRNLGRYLQFYSDCIAVPYSVDTQISDTVWNWSETLSSLSMYTRGLVLATFSSALHLQRNAQRYQ